jgi:hypothetical protein
MAQHFNSEDKNKGSKAMAKSPKKSRGRPPAGEFKGKSEVFTTRITPDTRKALEKAARQQSIDTGRRWSLSQEVERRLNASFREGRKRAGRDDIHALTEVVAMVLAGIEQTTGKHWREDAFTNEALRSGLDMVIRHFGARGEAVIPEAVSKTIERLPPGGAHFATPEGVGASEAGRVITWIESWSFSPPAPSLDDVRRSSKGNYPLDFESHWRLLQDLGSGWKRAMAK